MECLRTGIKYTGSFLGVVEPSHVLDFMENIFYHLFHLKRLYKDYYEQNLQSKCLLYVLFQYPLTTVMMGSLKKTSFRFNYLIPYRL